MKLHDDREAFGVLLDAVSVQTGIRSDILEKDYYITLMLWELSKKQETLPAFFKGGTALYKAIGSLKRFSEDIDLTVEVKDCSRSQGKKRLENAANAYTSLDRTKEKEKENNAKGSITSVYEYIPIAQIDDKDALQRFGTVKVEATSFTVSEPYEALTVEPLIYTKATEEQKQLLKEIYEVAPFLIHTIKMERIFADKLLACEFYYQRGLLFDVSKHLYDLAMMTKQERIQNLLADSGSLVGMLSYKRREERERIGSDLAAKPFGEFLLFTHLQTDSRLQKVFMQMQKVYVFADADRLEFSEMSKSMGKLNMILTQLDEGLDLNREESSPMTMK